MLLDRFGNPFPEQAQPAVNRRLLGFTANGSAPIEAEGGSSYCGGSTLITGRYEPLWIGLGSPFRTDPVA